MRLDNKSIDIHKKSVYKDFERMQELGQLAYDENTFFPKTVTYRDIDEEFTRFIGSIKLDNLDTSFPTHFITQQRFTEFTQTWKYVDGDNNILLNFKMVSRAINPNEGTYTDGNRLIPGDYMFEYYRHRTNENGKIGWDIYKMKPPMPVDLTYDVRFVTNKFDHVNQFSQNILDKFKSIQHYILVNGHYMPVSLEGVEDESAYNLDERKFYSIVVNMKVKGHIITENDFKVEHAKNTFLLSTGVSDLTRPSIISPNISYICSVLLNSLNKKRGENPLCFYFPKDSASIASTIVNEVIFESFRRRNKIKAEQDLYITISGVMPLLVERLKIKVNGVLYLDINTETEEEGSNGRRDIKITDLKIKAGDKITVEVIKTRQSKESEITLLYKISQN